MSDPVEPGGPLGPASVRASFLGQGQVPALVGASNRRLLVAGQEPLARELPDRLEHAEALRLGQDEVLLDERLQPGGRVKHEIATAHRVGGSDRPSPGEHREPREEPLLHRRQQLVAP